MPRRGFEALGVETWLSDACSGLGLKDPTAVQRGCIPAILEGRDVVGSAETGSGKTAAFTIPIVQKLSRDPRGIFAVVLTPTRELAFQISDQFRALGASMGIRDTVVVGGMDVVRQAAELSKKPHVVIATPGRLGDIMETSGSETVDLSRVDFLVLDEADRLLQSEFKNQLGLILQSLNPKRQTLLFSATMTPTLERLEKMATSERTFRFDSKSSRYATASQLSEKYMFMPDRVKDCYLVYLLKDRLDTSPSVVIFVSTCESCEVITSMLNRLDVSATSLHSQMPQEQRISRLQEFRRGTHRALVATDIASRGLDIPRVELIVNYDLPRAASTYVHRVGRTARASKSGTAVSMVTQYDVELVHSIEAKIGHDLEELQTTESEVLDFLAETLKAKRSARLDLTDSGFLDQLEKRRKSKRKRRP